MICMLISDHHDQERKVISKCAKDAVAYLGDEHIVILSCENNKTLSDTLDSTELLDMACVDVEESTGVQDAELIRREYPLVQMVLIVGKKQSPLTYIRPSIMASSLLMRPIDKTELSQTLNELIEIFMHGADEKSKEVFVIEDKEGVLKIPYTDICYFEARSKKIFVRLKSREYGFYKTLDELECTLPKAFLRCHRGFIVNMNHMKRYSASESMIYLDEDIMVPLSRSYRATVRNWIYAKGE